MRSVINVRRRFFFQLSLILTLTVVLSVSPAGAKDDGPGSKALSFLNVPVGGRPGGMGGAYAALADDAMGLTYTPAGSAWINQSEIGLQHNMYIEDIQSSYLAYLQPIGERITAGLFAQYQSSGNIPRTLINPNNATPARIGDFDATDLVLGLNVSYRFTEELAVGINGKYIRSEIEEESAQAGVIDIGARYNPAAFPRLRVGGSVSNIGSKIKYIQAEEDLPLTWRSGIAYDFVPNRFTLAADYIGFADGDEALAVGAEWWIVPSLALRGGYTTQNEVTEGFTAGLGFRLRNLSLDYAYMPFEELGDAHRVSLAARFGPSRGTEQEARSQEKKSLRVQIPFFQRRDEKTADQETADGKQEEQAEEMTGDATKEEEVKQPEEPARRIVIEPGSEAEVNMSLYETFMRQGDEAFNAGEYTRALESYRKAAGFNPASARAYFNMATCAYHLEDYAAAAELYRQAITQAPEDANAWLYLGFSEYQLGNTTAAIEAWQKTLKLDPNNRTARKNLETLNVSK